MSIHHLHLHTVFKFWKSRPILFYVKPTTLKCIDEASDTNKSVHKDKAWKRFITPSKKCYFNMKATYRVSTFHYSLKNENSRDTTMTYFVLTLWFGMDLTSSNQSISWFLFSPTCKSIAQEDGSYFEPAFLLKKNSTLPLSLCCASLC